MTDQFEAKVAAALRRQPEADAGEVARLRAYAAHLPTRSRFAVSPILPLAGAIAAGLLVVAFGLGWIGLPRPAAPGSSYPLVTTDARFAKCGGTVANALAAFPMPHAADYRSYLPRMGKAPVLETSSLAFVVIYRDRYTGPILPQLAQSPGARPTLAPDHRDLCVWVGDATSGESWIFADVDITGLSVPTAAPSGAPTPASPPPLAPVSGWSERVVDGSSQGIQVMGWSPDGSKFAVIGGQNASAYTVQVFDRDGRLLRTFPGWIAAWTDDDHLVSSGGFNPPDANTPTWLRSVSGGGDRQLDTGAATLIGPGGNGSVAMVGTTEPASRFSGEVFRVLRVNILGAQLPGYALGWSGDGTKLAYVTNVEQVGNVARGQLRVLGVTTMRTHDLGLLTEAPGTAVLGADGSRLMTCVAATATDASCHLAIIDTVRGSVLASSSLTFGSGAWVSADTLLVSNGGALYRWSIGSAPTKTNWQPTADGPGIEGVGVSRSTGIVLVPDGPGSGVPVGRGPRPRHRLGWSVRAPSRWVPQRESRREPRDLHSNKWWRRGSARLGDPARLTPPIPPA